MFLWNFFLDKISTFLGELREKRIVITEIEHGKYFICDVTIDIVCVERGRGKVAAVKKVLNFRLEIVRR